MNKPLPTVVRVILIILGLISLALGVIGIFIPILPTTPFVLLSAVCFMHGSKQAYDWLINNKYFGEYIRNYQQGNGITGQIKVISLTLLWLSIGSSAIFFVSSWWVRGFLLFIAIGVTYHLIALPTLKAGKAALQPVDNASQNPSLPNEFK